MVTGWTARMKMDDQSALDWTGRMRDLGRESEFDGWGANPQQAQDSGAVGAAEPG